MKNVLSLLFLCIFLFVASFIIVPKSSSDQLDDITKQINDLTSALNMSVNATKPLQSQLDSLKLQITGIKNRVAAIEQDVAAKKKNIDQGYADLAKEEIILHRTIRDYYIKSYYNSPLLMFLSGASASELTQVLAYQKAATDQDKVIITNIAITVQGLEENKKILENEQIKLTAIKVTLDEQSAKLDKIVTGAKAYQANLSGQIAQLSAKQQDLLAQKLGSLNIPLTAYTTQGGCSSDLTNGKNPGFSGGFGFFTYGVPNRVGLNQYGAKARAANQDYKTILNAYYQNIQFTTIDPNKTVTVNGTNEYGQTFSNEAMNIEEYVKHLYEMPASWPMEALKAQAVAARTYGLYSMSKGFVYPSQKDQVVKKEINDGNWQAAVDATKGEIMTYNGAPIGAWFSSTHGGYVYDSGGDIGNRPWLKNAIDAPSGSAGSFSDLKNNAYDKDSPWFYCDWGARSQYSGTAWLKPDEVADIVNVLLLAQKDSSTQKHLSQVDKPNPDGVDTWDAGRVKQELGSQAYSNISNISINADFGSGRTTTVNVSGDGKNNNFSGSDFKTYFNLRAPSNINIVGPLYNVEQR